MIVLIKNKLLAVLRLAIYLLWSTVNILKRRAPLREKSNSVSGRSWPRFSILTTLYVGTHVGYFKRTARSLIRQSYRDWEWLVLAHGPIHGDLQKFLDDLGKQHHNIRVYYLDENIGIIRGMRFLLERAEGDYCCALDGDDILYRDALRCGAIVAKEHSPEMIYTDEELLVGWFPFSPILRPDFDPLLMINNGFIWHLVLFKRSIGLHLEVFGNTEVEYCHDWDTVTRFYVAGFRPYHIPEILYRWRKHKNSISHSRKEAVPAGSQKAVLNLILERSKFKHLFEIASFPISRGVDELWCRRKEVAPHSMGVIQYAKTEEFNELHPFDGTNYSRNARIERVVVKQSGMWDFRLDLERAIESLEAAFVLIIKDGVMLVNPAWPWEVIGLFELFPEVRMVGARLLDQKNKVVSGGGYFGYGGWYGSPEAGLSADEPGYFSLALKSKSVDTVDTRCFVVQSDFLRSALPEIPEGASFFHLGAWLGGIATERGLRVAMSPLFAGCIKEEYGPPQFSEFEKKLFQYRFPFSTSSRWYSRAQDASGKRPYKLNWNFFDANWSGWLNG